MEITGNKDKDYLKLAAELETSREETIKARKEIEAYIKGSRYVLEMREFLPTARAIFDGCRLLIGAESGYVALLSPDGMENEVLFLEAGGRPCDVDPSLPMPIRGLRAEAYRFKKTVYDNRFAESEWMAFMPGGHVRLDNVLFAPLIINGETVGLMGIANKPGGFTADDERIASTFAELAAIALKNSRAFEALKQSEERYRSYIDNAPEGIIILDRSGNFLEVNPAACKITGRNNAELLTCNFPALALPNDAESVKQAFQQLQHQNEIAIESSFCKKDNTHGYWRIDAVKISRNRFLVYVKDITDRKVAEEKLKASLKEKELLMKEIHHRVKNNMAVICGLLSIQAGTFADPAVNDAFNKSQDRIRSMALVHEKLYKMDNLASIDFNDYLETLLASISQSNRMLNVAIHEIINTSNITLSIEQAIPCGLIINELLTNIYKYAFTNTTSGEIKVEMKTDKQDYILVISDNGMGLPPDFDIHNSQSFGLNLVEMLVQQLAGSLELDRSNGTTFSIRFPR